MKYSPKSGGRGVTAVAVLMLVAAVVLFAASSTTAVRLLPATVTQTIGVLFGVAGIYVLVRYRFISYTYVLSLRESGVDPDLCEAYVGEFDVTRVPPDLLDFTVYKKQGGRPAVAQCVLSAADLIRVETKEGRRGLSRAAKEYGASSFYDYTESASPEKTTLLYFSEGDGNIAVAVECDEKMADALRALSKER